jgi:hypothetical protein
MGNKKVEVKKAKEAKEAKEEQKVSLKPNPLDSNFAQLKIQMETLKPGSEEFKMIDTYI